MKNQFAALTICFLISLLVFACNTDTAPELKPLDLLSHGFPITVMAPDSANVKKSFSGLIDELTIIGGDQYGLLVQSSVATITDASKIKSDELDLVKGGKFFSKIIREDDAGFLYETAIDSTSINYEFFYVKIQGDKEYKFRTPYMGDYSEEDVTRIYESLFDKK